MIIYKRRQPCSLDLCLCAYKTRGKEEGVWVLIIVFHAQVHPRRTGRKTGDYLHRWRLHSLEKWRRIIRLKHFADQIGQKEESRDFYPGALARSNIDGIRKPPMPMKSWSVSKQIPRVAAAWWTVTFDCSLYQYFSICFLGRITERKLSY